MTRATVTIKTNDDRAQIARWAKNVEEGTVVTFRKKSRSTEQSAKMWAMLHEVADQVEWYGQKLEAEDWKDVFSASLRHARVVPGIDKGTYVPLGMHTSTLTIEEMSNLIELIHAFGAEHGVIFKEPKDNEPGPSPVQGPDADESPASSSSAGTTEPSPSSVVPTNTDTTDSRSGPVSDSAASGDGFASSPSPEDRSAETETLIQFAKDMLTTAGAEGSSLGAVKAIEQEYAAHIRLLSASGVSRARSISSSARAILEGNTSLESAIEFFSETLGCGPDEIGD